MTFDWQGFLNDLIGMFDKLIFLYLMIILVGRVSTAVGR